MSKGNYKKKRRNKEAERLKRKAINTNTIEVKTVELEKHNRFLLALENTMKIILSIPLLGRLILCAVRFIKKALLILLKPLAKIFVRLGNNTNIVNRIIGILYVFFMIVGILMVNRYLILLSSIFSFLFGFFTLGCIQKRINKTFHEVTGTSVYDKEFVVFINLGISLVLYSIILLFEKPVTAPYEFLRIANLGNLFMGVSLILIVVDSIIVKKIKKYNA